MKIRIFIGMLAVAAVVSGWAQGTTQFTVIPHEINGQEGDYADGELFVGPTIRQQLWEGTYLAEGWAEPVLINQISFRLNGGSPSTATVIPRVELRLATSQRTPENLTLFWEVNAGPDQRTVFLQSDYSFVATGGAGPTPFHVRFNLNEPFYFDPRAGNLLMYIETWSPSGQSFQGGREVDLRRGFEPGGYIGDNLTSPLAFSLVTQFGWQTVPEPTVFTLLLGGGFLFLLKRRRNAS